MKHLRYYKTSLENTSTNISPLVEYTEDLNSVIYTQEIKTIGVIDEHNVVSIDSSSLKNGNYTVTFADSQGKELGSWMNITTFTI